MVTVTDTAAGPARTKTGTVGFDSQGQGGFSGEPCTLSQTSPGMTGCSVIYTPGTVGSGFHTITAQYSGDAKHSGGILGIGFHFCDRRAAPDLDER
jgi:hypothetical protein